MKKRVLSALMAAVLILCVFQGLPARADEIPQLSASKECIDFIKQIEGFHAVPYWDYRQWTVGYGTPCPERDRERYTREGIPLDVAEALLQEHTEYFNREVNKFMYRHGLALTQQQFDAVFSLCYNIGAAWLYDSNNSLMQALLKGTNGNDLVYLYGLRSKAGGQFQQGLFKRRLMEADMFLNGRYNKEMPADYAYVTYDSGNGTCEATRQGYDMHLPAHPLALPTYEGHRFLGWYTHPNGGIPVTELNVATNGMTLYAHWEKIGAADQITGTPVEETLVTVQAAMLNVRSGPGVSYRITSCVPSGTELLITAVTTRNNTLWGKCSQGWVSLAHTDYRANTSAEGDGDGMGIPLPAVATVLKAGVAVHTGPHATYPQSGTLTQNQQIEILELTEFFGQQWARMESGWVRVNQDLLLHDGQLLAHSFVATVTNSYLNVRVGPGTSYAQVGTLSMNDQVQILAVKTVNGTLWGRYSQGWISLTYTDFDISTLERYENHVFGQWYEVKAATATEKGSERRDCQMCDRYETRETDRLPSEDTRIFGVVTGCEVLNVRAGAGSGNAWVGTLKKGDRVEILEQTVVNGKVWGRCAKGWFCITGYVTLETQSDEDTSVKKMTVTAYSLNIRAGAGSGYAVVGVLQKGDQVEVLETKTVDGKTWARIDRGWVSMLYLQ